MDRDRKRILVVGGTHGNEKSGIWTVEEMLRAPEAWEFPGLEVQPLLANPLAVDRNLRYLDRDLNRCFGPELAQARPDHPHWERRRAFEIRKAACPENVAPDLVIDLHNTTAAMGVTWILPRIEPLTFFLAWKASRSDRRVKILHTPETAESNIFLPSMGNREITIEIGPVAHGTHSHWSWLAAREQVKTTLEILSTLDPIWDPSEELSKAEFEYFETVSVEHYPLDASDKPRALIHQEAAGRDYQLFRDGDPLFYDPFARETIPYRGPDMHPVFLGEAAYVESAIAYHTTRRLRWTGTRGEPC